MTDFVNSLFSLKNKNAIITGGTRGIGASIAEGLAGAGAHVILLQRDLSNTTTADRIKKAGGQATIIECDLGVNSQVNNVVPKVLKIVDHIDILINCGGIQRRFPAEDFPEQDWDDVLQINLKSVFLLIRNVGKHMLTSDRKGRGNGKIISIASLVSFQGGLTVPAYTAAKHGITGITKSFANEWSSKGINVNAIAPGYIATDMTDALMKDENRSRQIMERIPAQRWGKPSDFMGPVIFLSSPASDYVCGDCMLVDGGWMGR
ncbi:Sps19p [Sugiyamaella lignohabitans]|uniref:Sps19p n=1 Tax=Sugiyamaella lignohabitans TaxID=796027 RepID=A0A167FUX3_9ASCO|nr:Sps19p [Sugiyamaella lignohabitans]ANB15732.1 Sps19p [Sugiyamaella lignohabitans]